MPHTGEIIIYANKCARAISPPSPPLLSSLSCLLSSRTLSRSISERTRARDILECAFRDPLAAHFGETFGLEPHTAKAKEAAALA